MKKKLIIIIAVIAIIFVAVIVCLSTGVFKKKIDVGDTYDENISVINANQVNIYTYKNSVSFRSKITCHVINSLTEIDQETNSFLIIEDRAGTLNLTDDFYASLLGKNSYLTVIYIGDSKLNTFLEKGFYENALDSGSKGFMRIGSSNEIIQGFWTNTEEEVFKTNQELIGSVTCSLIVRVLKK